MKIISDSNTHVPVAVQNSITQMFANLDGDYNASVETFYDDETDEQLWGVYAIFHEGTPDASLEFMFNLTASGKKV